MAERALRDVFPETPLQLNAHLSARYNAEIWLKREDLGPVRSYKLRGACTAMRARMTTEPSPLFVAASAGNHAQGVAFMCRHLRQRGVIFMPVTTPRQKIMKTRLFGGDMIEIRLFGDYFDDTLATAKAFCEAQGGAFLSPFDDPDVILGQASVGIEIEDALGAAPDEIVLPVGGGGLASGVASWFGDRVGFRFVEPEGAPSLAAAFRAGEPVRLPKVDNFVDGASVAEIGAEPFARLRRFSSDNTLTVPENRLCGTMLDMLNIEGIVLEPAGALAVDALQDLADGIQGKRIVVVTSGGNFDFERLPEVRERAQRYAGLKKYLVLRLPQRPGALRDFLDRLGPEDDISRFEYLKKSARNFGSVLIGIETLNPANFARLFAALDQGGYVWSDITDDELLAQLLI